MKREEALQSRYKKERKFLCTPYSHPQVIFLLTQEYSKMKFLGAIATILLGAASVVSADGMP